MIALLTIIDSQVQLAGEIGQAWTWEADEVCCPFIGGANSTLLHPVSGISEEYRE